MEKEFDNFKVYYANARGIKSKMDSIERILMDIEPQVVCITETHLEEKEKIKLKGYRVFDNNNKKGKGGIIIAVKGRLKNVAIETEKITKEYQILWIRIDNKSNKINIGTVYAPQESREKIPVFKEMYAKISERINKIKHDQEKLFLTRDFNAKVGTVIPGNKDEVSKSGPILMSMVLEQELAILNTSPKCEGKWTRRQGQEESVLEYAMVMQEDEKHLISIRIDEEKSDTPQYTKQDKTTFSDHCAMITEINWTEASNEEHKCEDLYIINDETLQRFNEETDGTELTAIAKGKKDLHSKYQEWTQTISNIMKKCFLRTKKKGIPILRAQRKLNQLKRNVRKKQDINLNTKKRYIKKLNELIEKEIKRNNATITMKTAERIGKEGKLQTGAFWEFKKKMDKSSSQEMPSAMLNKKKEEKTTKQEIKSIFEEFYTELFEPTQPTTVMEELCQNITQQVFDHIMEKANNDKTPKMEIKEEEIGKAIKGIKNKTSLDCEGMSNKMIKNGGNDFTKSITILFEEINQQNEAPDTWENMMIKSIYKGKKSKKEMENRRGLFLTNVISKLFEKVKMNRNRDTIESGISRFQTGGIKERSRIDNIMTFNAMIDYNNLIRSETYALFADAYKCFDKLDLKTCIIDLYEILGHQEAKLMYNMNKKSKITIQTPVGDTKQISIGEIVKQGTLSGPILCDINTDKVNRVGLKSTTTIGPNITCESLAYVDDIHQGGSHVHNIETAATNCSVMETTRGFTFNNEPNKTAFMIINPKKGNQLEKLRNTIKRGEIGRTQEYEYVGEWYTEKGTHEKSLSVKRNKVNYLVNRVKHYGDPYKVGNLALQVRITIYSSVVIPTLFTNIETWSRISTREMEELEKIQKDSLTWILELPISTPYKGLLSELGIWPVEQQMEYKRLSILHQILTSEDKRLLKEIVEDQIKHPYSGCWTELTLLICEKYEIEVKEIIKKSKKQFKREIKRKIATKLEEELKEEVKEKTKMRFCANMKKEKYLEQLEYSDAKMILKLKLNMTELKCNYKNQNKDLKCNLCNEADDTTEHLFQCKILKENIGTVETRTGITTDDKHSNEQLAAYIKSALREKNIDRNKNVRDNLAGKEKPKNYKIMKFDEKDLKMVIKIEEKKNYQIKRFDETDLKMVISSKGREK